MAGTAEGVRKSWLKRKRGRKGIPLNKRPRPETEDTLKKGQTILELAKKWGVSAKSIIKLNNLKDPAQLVEGLKLRIPAILSKEQKEAESLKKAFESNKKKEEREKKKQEKEKKKRESGK